MAEKDEKGNCLRIGSVLFYFCWLSGIALLALVLIFGVGSVSNTPGIFLILVLLGLLMFPFLRSFSIGNVFSMEVKELSNSVDRLRDSVQNLISIQFSNTQNVIFANLDDPDGRSIKFRTKAISEKFSEQAINFYRQGHYLKAIELYEKALEEDSENWFAAMFLGYLYLSLNNMIKEKNWGLNNTERLLRSVFYSKYATNKDNNHYLQFMNLGIALRHLAKESLTELGLQNLAIAYKMLDSDPQVGKNSGLMTAKGKCRNFMGEFAAILNLKEKAIQYRTEAIEIFRNGLEPVPKEVQVWLKDAITAPMSLT